jgi:hypothetical protein
MEKEVRNVVFTALKAIAAAAICTAVFTTAPVYAKAKVQQETERCPGRTKMGKGPNGQRKLVCLDGRHSTCMRDSQRLGWMEHEAKRYCGRKRDQGRVR